MGHRSYYFHKFAFISTSVSVLGPATSIDFDVQSENRTETNRNPHKYIYKQTAAGAAKYLATDANDLWR